RKDVGEEPVVPIEPLAELDAGAQPRDHPIFGKPAKLDRPGHVAETLQCCVKPLQPRHSELPDGPDLENAVPEQSNADSVAGAAEGFGRAEAANSQDRIGP